MKLLKTVSSPVRNVTPSRANVVLLTAVRPVAAVTEHVASVRLAAVRPNEKEVIVHQPARRVISNLCVVERERISINKVPGC